MDDDDDTDDVDDKTLYAKCLDLSLFVFIFCLLMALSAMVLAGAYETWEMVLK